MRDIREKIEIHNKIHKFLMDYYEIMSDKKGQASRNVNKMETKLYLLDSGRKHRYNMEEKTFQYTKIIECSKIFSFKA